MKRLYSCLGVLLFFTTPLFCQEDLIKLLNGSQIGHFAQPLATSLGEAVNSGSFHSASIPKSFRFSVSFRGMLVLIPSSQLTFTPTLPSGYKASSPTATIWGADGTIYTGPNGYIPYPNGLDQSNFPFAVPQITASLFGTEVMLRYIPDIPLNGAHFYFNGYGLRHSISQHVPMMPVDVAVGVLYNKLGYSNIISAKTLAVNGEVSKRFGVFTAYGGIQYENSELDFTYILKGDPNNGDPSLRQDASVSASVRGKNNFRLIAGGSLKLAFIVLNADFNLASQPLVSSGLSFEF